MNSTNKVHFQNLKIGKVVGLTGSKDSKLEEICNELFIEYVHLPYNETEKPSLDFEDIASKVTTDSPCLIYCLSGNLAAVVGIYLLI